MANRRTVLKELGLGALTTAWPVLNGTDKRASSTQGQSVISLNSPSDVEIEYNFTVSGILEKSEHVPPPLSLDAATIDPDDQIDGSTAHGSTQGGVDSYTYSGEITAFDTTNCAAANVWVDDSPVDACRLRQAGPPDTQVSDGSAKVLSINSPSDTQVAYEVSVTGQLEKSEHVPPELSTDVATKDPIDVIDGSVVNGSTQGGVDSYRYTGEIDTFTATNCSSANVWVDDNEVDACQLAGSDSPESRGIDITGGQAVKTSSTLTSRDAPPNVWIIGDTILFRITVTPSGNQAFEGDADFEIYFQDIDGQGGIDTSWGDGVVTLHKVAFTRALELDSGERTVIEKEVELADAYDRVVNGANPSLAFTDQVGVHAMTDAGELTAIDDDDCSPQSTCLTPEENVIRAGFVEITAVIVSFATALLGAGPALMPGPEDGVIIGLESMNLLTVAMLDLRNENFGAAETNLQKMFEESGYSSADAGTLAAHLADAAAAESRGDYDHATMQVLKAVHHLRVSPMSVDWRSILPTILDALIGNYINLYDVIPTLVRGMTSLEAPTDTTTTGTSTTVAPRDVAGTVLTDSGNPVANVTVDVFNHDPRESQGTPLLTAETDSEGAFQTPDPGPSSPEVLWFRVREDNSLLTQQPITRSYHPDDYLPGGYGYRLYINREQRPFATTDLTVTRQDDGTIEAQQTLGVEESPADVTPWESAGGTHLRVVRGSLRRAAPGDFANRALGNHLRERVDTLEEASIVEFTANERIQPGETLRTGSIRIEPDESGAPPEIAYRSWAFDTTNALLINGERSPFVARAPTGPNYNRHVTNKAYTFLNYPVNVH